MSLRTVKYNALLLLGLIAAAGLAWSQLLPAKAATGINQQINYQGKLMDTNSNQVSNGSWNFKFEIYDASSGGTLLWTERWTSTTTQVTTVNGVFSAPLGSLSQTDSLSSVNWNSDSLYLQVSLDADANGSWEESFATRKRFSSASYAFNADMVDGFHATSTAAVASYLPAYDSTKTLNLFTGGVSSTRATTSAFVLIGHDGAITNLDRANGDLYVMGDSEFDGTVYFQGAVVSSNNPTLPHTFGSWATGAANSNVSNSVIYINPASAVADSNLLGLAVNSSVMFMVDAEGDVFANNLTLAGTQSVGLSTISTLTVENNSYLGDAPNADWTHIQGSAWIQTNKSATASSTALVITQQGTGNYLEVSNGATYYNDGTRYFTITNSGVASTTQLFVQNAATSTNYLVVGSSTGSVDNLNYASGDLYVQDGLEVDGQLFGTTGRLSTLNASTTNITSLNLFSELRTPLIHASSTDFDLLNVYGNATTTGWFNVGTTDVVGTLGSLIGAGDLFVGSDATITNGFIVDAGTLYVDAQANRVGIGVTNPSYTLDVAGFVNVDQYSGYKLAGDTILVASSTNSGTFVGIGAGNAVTDTGLYNTAVGYQALNSVTTADFNSALGYQALYANTSGVDNTALGYLALRTNVDGNNNTAVGHQALYLNDSGSDNTALGFQSLYSNTSGTKNLGLGEKALFSNGAGADNTAAGYFAAYGNVNGSNNTAFGYFALYGNTVSNNTAFGYKAGYGGTDDSNYTSVLDTSMTFLGYQASRNSTVATTTVLTNSMALGNGALVNASNQVVIGNDSILTTLLKGKVGIGFVSPTSTLDVNGTAYFHGNATTSGWFNVGTTDVVGTLFSTIGAGDLFVGSDATITNGLIVDAGTLFVNAQGNNVGIGTTTPKELLHISTDQNTDTVLRVENDNAGTAAYTSVNVNNGDSINDSVRLIVLGTGFTTTGGYFQDGAALSTETALSGGLSLITRAAAPIMFYTGGHTNQRMVIDSSGKVGIGFGSPTSTLDVNGTAYFHGNATTSGWFNIGTTDVVGTLFGAIGAGDLYVSRNATTTGNLTVASSTAMTTGSGPGLFVDAYNSRVGIGMTGPTEKLTVNGSVLLNNITDGFIVAGGASNDVSGWGTPWYGLAKAANTGLDLSTTPAVGHGAVTLQGYYGLGFQTNSGIMVMKQNGNVGIGTSSPAFQLDVEETASATIPLRVIAANTYSGVRYDTWSSNAAARNWFAGANVYAYGDFGWMTSRTAYGDPKSGIMRLLIDSSGRVGIGRETPSSTLDIFGTLSVSGNATSSGWFNIGTTDVVGTLGSLIGAGDLYVGGNATITSDLMVVGSADTYAYIASTGTGKKAYLKFGELYPDNIDYGYVGFDGAGNDMYLYNRFNDPEADLFLGTADATRITIKGSGSVNIAGDTKISANASTTGWFSIGATNPLATIGSALGAGDLYVSGNATVTKSFSLDSGKILFDSSENKLDISRDWSLIHPLLSFVNSSYTNVQPNPSVENGTTGWGTLGTNAIAVNTTVALHGNNSLKVTYNNDLRLAYQATTLDLNSTYKATMWVYVPSGAWNGTNALYFQVDIGLSDGSRAQNTTADPTVTDTWQKIEATITTGATDGSGYLIIYVDIAPSAGSYFYVDNFQITKTSGIEPFSALSTAVPQGLILEKNLTLLDDLYVDGYATTTKNFTVSTTTLTVFNGSSRESNRIGIGNIAATSTLQVLGSVNFTNAVDASGFYFDYANRRVGIGTTAPVAPLHISLPAPATAAEALRLQVPATFGVYQQFTDGTYNAYMGVENSAGSGIFGSGLAYALNIGTADAYPITFHTNNVGTPAMVIESGGYVGINTTDPSVYLDVTGDTTIVGGLAVGSAGIADNTADGLLQVCSGACTAATIATGAGEVYAEGDLEADGNLNVLGTGGFGIAPAAGVKVDIDTGSNTLGLRLRGLAETTEIADFYLQATALTFDVTAGDGGMFLDLRPEHNNYGVLIRDSDGSGTAAYGNLFVVDETVDYLSIKVNGTVQAPPALVIDQDEQVGIGTEHPAYSLDVNATSTTYAEQVSLVSTAGTATYVSNFFNDGNDVDYHGLRVAAGLDAPGSAGTTYYLNAYAGDNTTNVGYLANVAGVFGVTDASDARLKTNITDTAVNGLAVINGLRVADFNRIYSPDSPPITGFIAQEVQKIYPHMVSVGADGYLGLMKDQLIPVLVKAVQQQQAQIDWLQSSATASTTEPLQVITNPDIGVQTLVVEQAATFYGTMYVVGEAGFEHKVVFKDDVEIEGKLYVSADQAGTIVVPAGATSTEVVFSKPFNTVPKINVTPLGRIGSEFWISDKTSRGFRLNLDHQVNQNDVSFDWLALGLNGDGAAPTINDLVVSNQTVGIGIPVELWAKVTDPDTSEQDLTYTWSFSPEIGSLSGTSGLVYWTVDSLETNTPVVVTVHVSDGKNTVEKSTTITVFGSGQVAGAETIEPTPEPTPVPEPTPEPTPTVVLGCTDQTADNYNPSATTDDGACTYPTTEPTPVVEEPTTPPSEPAPVAEEPAPTEPVASTPADSGQGGLDTPTGGPDVTASAP